MQQPIDIRQLYFSGRDGDIQHGVGILVNKTIIQYVSSYLIVIERVLPIQMKGALWNMNLIQTYASIAEKSKKGIEDFRKT